MYKTADNKNIMNLLNKPGECKFWYIENYQVGEISCYEARIDKQNNRLSLISRYSSILYPEQVYSTEQAATRALVKILREQIRRTLVNN